MRMLWYDIVNVFFYFVLIAAAHSVRSWSDYSICIVVAAGAALNISGYHEGRNKP